MDLLERTIERAKRIHALQERAYDHYFKQIAEQIDFLQRQGVTKMIISIPPIINGVPIRQEEVHRKIRKSLRKVGFSVTKLENFGLEISWYIV
jgi:vacuolar-type H+-ATPase subunit F/Vma7